MSDTIESRVINVVTKGLKPDEPQKITLVTRFVEDLNADSLDIVELLMALEEEFKVEISDSEAQKIKTVQDVVSYIQDQQKDGGSSS